MNDEQHDFKGEIEVGDELRGDLKRHGIDVDAVLNESPHDELIRLRARERVLIGKEPLLTAEEAAERDRISKRIPELQAHLQERESKQVTAVSWTDGGPAGWATEVFINAEDALSFEGDLRHFHEDSVPLQVHVDGEVYVNAGPVGVDPQTGMVLRGELRTNELADPREVAALDLKAVGPAVTCPHCSQSHRVEWSDKGDYPERSRCPFCGHDLRIRSKVGSVQVTSLDMRVADPPKPSVADFAMIFLGGSLEGLSKRFESDGFGQASFAVKELVERIDDYLFDTGVEKPN